MDYSDHHIHQLSTLFGALADPTRARLLLHLMEAPQRSGDLAAQVGLSPSAASHQLRWLRDHHIVSRERNGREAHYSLADDCIRDLLTIALRHIQESEPITL